MRLISELAPVALGGALGASSRYILARATALLMFHLPVGTLLANALGSLLAGALLGLVLLDTGQSPGIKLFFMTGFLGSFTTFSAFTYETMELWLGEEQGLAFFNVIANVSGALFAVILGYWLVQRFYA